MTSPHDPGPLFASTFSVAIRNELTDALAAAYATATELHDPKRGSNESTFGYGLYHYSIHEICARVGDRMTVVSRQPSFRFRVGDYELACHRVGTSEREDICQSFPNAENAAYTMCEAQLWLPGMGGSPGLQQARRLVLAHMGNAEDGFRAAYLCIPGETDGTRIVRWAFADPIWTAGQSVEDNGLHLADNEVPEESVGEPVVRRKPKKDTADEDNE